MKRVSASEARVHLGELLRAVGERDEVVEVVRRGEPAAIILSPAAYGLLVSESRGDEPDVFARIDAVVADMADAEVATDQIVAALERTRAERSERQDDLLR